ncbi:MAG: tetratricopeptide repeat protein [Oscillospiraceae bacterium]|nr:tetratricopeptide repeat protein [Oscillospiraceae bacterium]
MDLFEQLDALYEAGWTDMIVPFLHAHLDEARNTANHPLAIAILNELGSFYQRMGAYDEAGGYYDNAISEMDDLGLQNSYGYAVALINRAEAYRGLEYPDVADSLLLVAEQILAHLEAEGSEANLPG